MSRPRTPNDPNRKVGDTGTQMRNTYSPDDRKDRYAKLKERPYNEGP